MCLSTLWLTPFSAGSAQGSGLVRSPKQSLNLLAFEQFLALAVTYHVVQPVLPALEEVMENFAELMHRLLEIQSGGLQRSPELIAEDGRLMEGLQKRHSARKPAQTVKHSQDSPERERSRPNCFSHFALTVSPHKSALRRPQSAAS
jgi:hypothetical protein